jgi:hypothetical protein
VLSRVEVLALKGGDLLLLLREGQLRVVLVLLHVPDAGLQQLDSLLVLGALGLVLLLEAGLLLLQVLRETCQLLDLLLQLPVHLLMLTKSLLVLLS